jgi:beta-mannosidase
MFEMNLSQHWRLTMEPISCGAVNAPYVLRKKEPWYPCSLPNDIHMTLIENGLMPEPLEKLNSLDCQWAEGKSWWYLRKFTVDSINYNIMELTLESLDGWADVFLNGVHIGRHKSAFYPFRRDVRALLFEGENTLLVRLTTGLEHITDAQVAELKGNTAADCLGNMRGDKRVPYLRKPQYACGWDWGPRLTTCGIVKSAALCGYNGCAVRDTYIRTVKIENNQAVMKASVTVENFNFIESMDAQVKIRIAYDGAEVCGVSRRCHMRSGVNYVHFDFLLDNPRLWWPNGMGQPNLYTAQAGVTAQGETHDAPPFAFGVRTIEIDQSKTDDGRLFSFAVNGVKIFCKGANWIPADSIYARVAPEKYETLLLEAKDANFNMLRVWGGGLYEQDIFYETCDKHGILVWQDFMFACAMYPDNEPDFISLTEKELEHQTRKLRKHACLALFCGGNENIQGFYEWWPIKNDRLPGGAYVYNHLAPMAVERNCPEIPYWNSSPYGGASPNGVDYGDTHEWRFTMSSVMEDRITPERYDGITSKFVAEYGYIGPCSRSGINRYHAGEPVEVGSEIWRLHNNTFEKETVPAGIAKHYADAALSMDEYLLYAGMCQAMMLEYSLEAIRYKNLCGGALFWMYNDCWGEVGWTIIDYYLKRKPSYYAVKRAFAPVKIILRKENGSVNAVFANEHPHPITMEVEYGRVSFDGKANEAQTVKITLPPRSRAVQLTFAIPKHDPRDGVVFVRPVNDEAGAALLRECVPKERNIPRAEINVKSEQTADGALALTVSSEGFCHGVHFKGLEENDFSDLYFDLLPNREKRVILRDPPAGAEKIIPSCIILS